jgi:hypothetical protein
VNEKPHLKVCGLSQRDSTSTFNPKHESESRFGANYRCAQAALTRVRPSVEKGVEACLERDQSLDRRMTEMLERAHRRLVLIRWFFETIYSSIDLLMDLVL